MAKRALLSFVSLFLFSACELVEPPEGHGESSNRLQNASSSLAPAPDLAPPRQHAQLGVEEIDAVAAGMNRLALALLETHARKSNSDENIAFSPLALQSALLGVQHGTYTATQCELGTQLRLGLAAERTALGLAALGGALFTPAARSDHEATLHASSAAARALWAEPFATSASHPERFFGPAGARDVTMMRTTRSLPLYEDKLFQLVSIPLEAEGRARSLIVILPRSNTWLPAVEALLEKRPLCRWIADAESREVALTLPRVQFATRWAMREALQAVGIRRVFSDPEALSGLRRPLNQVVHAARFSLDEAGIGAPQASAPREAATDDVVSSAKAHVFRADHPFLMMLRDDESGALLMIARVVTP